jgi:hypothetical protein
VGEVRRCDWAGGFATVLLLDGFAGGLLEGEGAVSGPGERAVPSLRTAGVPEAVSESVVEVI